MQTRSEAEQADQLVRQIRSVQEAVEQSRSGLNAQSQLRQELRAELQALEARRDEIGTQLRHPMISGANQKGLENRVVQLDARIASLDQRISELDGVPQGTTIRGGAGVGMPPRGRRDQGFDGQPEPGIVLGGLFMVCVLLPISIAFARRIWRKGAAVVTSIPNEINERLSRMDQNLDAIAVEVERVGEGQRFLTRVYAEQLHGLPPGQAERIETPERDKVGQRRGS